MKLTLATRSSALALWQAHEVAQRVARQTVFTTALLELKASADLDTSTPLERFGRTALFTAEVDRAVLDGRAHAGVHSLKDATTTLEPGLALVAVLPRGPIEDVLVTRNGGDLASLRRGARVATGSLRRAAMLRRERPDLDLVPLRGNVATRLARLEDNDLDGLLMARAALVRLGLTERPHAVLDPDRFVPAVSQGIVGIVAREADAESHGAFAAIGDGDTLCAATAERALLRELRGGCNVPAGALARIDGDHIDLHAVVLSPDGTRCVEGVRRGRAKDAAALGKELALELLAGGAADLLALARP